MEVKTETFGKKNGQTVYSYTIKNDKGLEFSCINYGCVITEILTPDREGNIENIVLGFDSIEEYENYSAYFGAVVGRFAGRIKDAKFQLDGKEYHLSQNHDKHHLHGGDQGFSEVLWEADITEKEDEVTIKFSYVSPDGEEGYPGNVNMTVKYTINNNNELTIHYQGISDQKTVLNATNHSYFNLSGNLKQDVLKHQLTIASDEFLELDEECLPTGKFLSVEGTAFDFRKGRRIEDGVNSTHPQNLIAGKGYDHPFLLNRNHQQEITLVDSESGRKLIVETDEPSVIVYTGNGLGGEYAVRGVPARDYLGICLETQAPPDSLNHPHFPSSILKPNEVYQSKTKYTFTIN